MGIPHIPDRYSGRYGCEARALVAIFSAEMLTLDRGELLGFRADELVVGSSARAAFGEPFGDPALATSGNITAEQLRPGSHRTRDESTMQHVYSAGSLDQEYLALQPSIWVKPSLPNVVTR